MTTLDKRIAELIQAEVDGELTARDRETLEEALRSDPQAQEFMDEMQLVAKLMNELPDVEPPQRLRRNILDSIELPSSSAIIKGPASWFKPSSYGLAMAAGVLIAVGVDKITPDKQANLNNLVGTMVNRTADLIQDPSSELDIENDNVNGQIKLKNMNEAWVIQFDLYSQDSIEVAVNLAGSSLSFGGFADEDSSIDHFEVSEGKVRLMNQGDHQFVLFLRNQPKGEGVRQEIGVEVSHLGETIYSGSLGSGR